MALKKKSVVWILLAVLVVFFCWRIYQSVFTVSNNHREKGKKGSVAVETVSVKQQTIADIGVFTGSLRPASQFVVASKIIGRLKNLLVDIGDKIENGQLVAVLDDQESTLKLKQAAANLEVAKAILESRDNSVKLTQKEYRRVKSLRANKVVSDFELDTKKSQYSNSLSDYRVAKAQLTEKTAAYEAANIQHSYTKINVVWEGKEKVRVVGERFADEGALLNANAPIVSILDISNLLAIIYVTERDYFKLTIGQNVILNSDSIEGKSFPGKILRIAPLLVEASREARVEILVPNPEEVLKPGMFVKSHIQFEEHKNATVVPVSAVVDRDFSKGVFMVDVEKSIARFVPVRLGIVNESLAEVITPNLSGEVVTLGHHLLKDGSKISVPSLNTENQPDTTKPKKGKR